MSIAYSENDRIFNLKKDLILNVRESVKIGEATARAVGKGKVGVGYINDESSKTNAMAVMAGLSSSGVAVWDFGPVFEAQLSFLVPFCSLGAGIFVDSKNNTLRILGTDGLGVMPGFKRRVEEYRDAQALFQNKYGKIFDMSALTMLYREELSRLIMLKPHNKCRIETENEDIKNLLSDIIGNDENSDLTFKIDCSGKRLTAVSRETGEVSLIKIEAICALYELKNGSDISVPFDSPKIFDTLAHTYGKKAFRYLSAPSDSSSSASMRLAKKQFFLRDAIFALVKLTAVMLEEEKSLSELLSELPNFYLQKKVVNLAEPIDFLEKFKGEGFSVERDRDKGLFISNVGNFAHVLPICQDKAGILIQCQNMASAQDFCLDIERVLKNAEIS